MPEETKLVQMQEYEFNDEENETIETLASAIRFVGTGMTALGSVLGLISGFYLVMIMAQAQGGSREVLLLTLLAIQTFGCAFAAVIGLWLRDASQSFEQIVSTQGNDIANLMEALTELGRVYGLQRILLIMGTALGGIGLVVIFIASGVPLV